MPAPPPPPRAFRQFCPTLRMESLRSVNTLCSFDDRALPAVHSGLQHDDGLHTSDRTTSSKCLRRGHSVNLCSLSLSLSLSLSAPVLDGRAERHGHAGREARGRIAVLQRDVRRTQVSRTKRGPKRAPGVALWALCHVLLMAGGRLKLRRRAAALVANPPHPPHGCPLFLFCFLLRTALRTPTRNHQPPTAANRQPLFSTVSVCVVPMS